jgi:apolipoprotein D and lipocalin family protein
MSMMVRIIVQLALLLISNISLVVALDDGRATSLNLRLKQKQDQHKGRRLPYGTRISDLIDTVLKRNTKCPPKNFGSLKKFDLNSYISKSWYAIKQIPLSYQPIEDFFCVRADYIKDTDGCLLCNDKPRIKVYNQARSGSVTGTIGGAPYSENNPSSDYFFGMQKNPENEPAQLTVGFFPQLTPAANYWIVAAGTYAEALAGSAKPSTKQYDWAIVTGGTAGMETDNGKCIPKPGAVPFLGMWMFARDGVPPDGVINSIEVIASDLGLDTTKWLPVKQDGCVFE